MVNLQTLPMLDAHAKRPLTPIFNPVAITRCAAGECSLIRVPLDLMQADHCQQEAG